MGIVEYYFQRDDAVDILNKKLHVKTERGEETVSASIGNKDDVAGILTEKIQADRDNNNKGKKVMVDDQPRAETAGGSSSRRDI